MSDQIQIVQNLTPKRLKIRGTEGRLLVLAPLEKKRRLKAADLTPFDYQSLELRNLIKVEKESTRNVGNRVAEALPAFATFVFFAFIMGHAFTKDHPNLNVIFWVAGVGITLIITGVVVLALAFGSVVAKRLLAQFFSLALVLGFGIALPAVVIFNFNGGLQLIADKSSLLLLGRAFQFIFIITASLLPALLYFLFDRQQLGTLRDRFEQQIFRLDPNVKNLVDVHAKYGKQLSEVYGPESDTGEGRLIRATRWPIFMATLVITLGWLLALSPADRTLTITQASDLSNLFLPRPTAMTFAFLGAYFFALNTILLRYTRADLKPKAYSSITVRIFLVVILAWVIGTFLTDGKAYTLVAAFLIGIFPESAITLMREYVRTQSFSWEKITLAKEEYPLTNLQDIDVYDRARLADEGVTNIEGLAHHDLVDLMLETRIPVPRLVDWVDQAILYLHVVTENKPDTSKSTTQPQSAVTSGDLRQCLRTYGVRTATDFINAWRDGEGHLAKAIDQECVTFKQLQVLFDVMQDDEWLHSLKHWRKHNLVETEGVYAPAPASPVSQASPADTQESETDTQGQSSQTPVEMTSAAAISLATQGSNGGKLGTDN